MVALNIALEMVGLKTFVESLCVDKCKDPHMHLLFFVDSNIHKYSKSILHTVINIFRFCVGQKHS